MSERTELESKLSTLCDKRDRMQRDWDAHESQREADLEKVNKGRQAYQEAFAGRYSTDADRATASSTMHTINDLGDVWERAEREHYDTVATLTAEIEDLCSRLVSLLRSGSTLLSGLIP